jgi:hypothetical protein
MTRLHFLVMSLATLTACGGSKVHHLADGGADAPTRQDAETPDAHPDAAAPQVVTIAVTENGSPAAGAIVYFQNADSSLVAELQTGSDGTASQLMAAGGFVTLIEPQLPVGVADVTGLPEIPSNQEIDTFSDVKPGDVLHVDLVNEGAATAVTFPVIVPADGSASRYELFTTCGDADLDNTTGEEVPHPLVVDGPTNVTLDNCNGIADMLVVTLDSDDNGLNSLYAPGVPIADGSAVVLLTQSYVPITQQSIVVTNIPTLIENDTDGAEHDIFGPHGEFEQFLNLDTNAEGNAEVVTYDQPSQPVVSFAEEFFGGNGTSVPDDQTIGDWGPPSATNLFVDATAERLPDYTGTQVFDVPSQEVQFQVTGGGSDVSVDGVYATVSFSRTVEVGGGSGSGSGSGSAATPVLATWDWFVIAPGTEVGAVKVPTVPTDVFAWNGAVGDTIDIDFIELGHVTGGYDAVRGSLWDFDFPFAGIVTSPTGGHAVTDILDQQPIEDVVHPSVSRTHHRPKSPRQPHAPRHTWRTTR